MENLTCRECGETKPASEFYARYDRPGERFRQCRDCARAYSRRRYAANRERLLAEQRIRYEADRDGQRLRMRTQNAEIRDAAIAAYGGRCTCCGETRTLFLNIDHINEDGAEHRRRIGNGGNHIARWLRAHGYPPGFQVLCWNCNRGKYFNGGTCPHQEENPRQFTPPALPVTVCPECGYESSPHGVATHRAKLHREIHDRTAEPSPGRAAAR